MIINKITAPEWIEISSRDSGYKTTPITLQVSVEIGKFKDDVTIGYIPVTDVDAIRKAVCDALQIPLQDEN